MANGVLGWINIFETGTFTAGSELSSAPASNLTIPQGAEPWVTAYGVVTSAAGATLSLDAGSVVDWRAFGLFRTNLSTSATVRYRLGTTDGASDVFDTGALSGIVAGVNQHVYVHTSQLSAQFLTVSIEDSSNPDGQISVGLAFAGPVLQPRVNFSYEVARGRVNRTDSVDSSGGQSFKRQMWQKRNWSLAWAALDGTELPDYLEEADRYGRAGSNVLFVPDYEDSPMRYAVFGEMTDPSPFAFSSYGGDASFSWKVNVLERL